MMITVEVATESEHSANSRQNSTAKTRVHNTVLYHHLHFRADLSMSLHSFVKSDDNSQVLSTTCCTPYPVKKGTTLTLFSRNDGNLGSEGRDFCTSFNILLMGLYHDTHGALSSNSRSRPLNGSGYNQLHNRHRFDTSSSLLRMHD
jgi:hypothetical protein